jgi:hypothetical protein
MLPAEAQKALAQLCDRSGQLKAVTKRVFIIDENGVVAGDDTRESVCDMPLRQGRGVIENSKH